MAHLFEDSTTILERPAGANRACGAILKQQSGWSKEWHGRVTLRFADHSVVCAKPQGIRQQREDYQSKVPFAHEDLQHLRDAGRNARMPVHTDAIVFWSGNEKKRGAITSVRECQERSATAACVARLLRPFETALFVAGHHADLPAMPPEFDAHVADIRLTMDTVGVPTTCARRMVEAMYPFRGDSWHSNFSEGSQWALILSIAELSVLT